MPKEYAVLDNGMGGRPGKGKKKQRKFVGKYLASKGVEKSPTGSRSKREMKLRAEGRAMFQAKKNKKSGSGSSAKSSTSVSKTATPKKVVTATRPKETGEMRSGGLGNTKAERSRGMSALEARYLDVGNKGGSKLYASSPKTGGLNPNARRNYGKSKTARQRFLKSEKKGY